MKIALALSGGGFRATVFHLGVLARLAKEGRLEEITYLSTVSGGSLCAGLVIALSQNQWPSSQAYLDHVLPAARQILITRDLKSALIKRVVLNIWDVFDPRANELAALLAKDWGININLNQLPESPRWMINATCYETGKNWRFERFRMGDYLFGYTYDTDYPLSSAMAASAGFPGLIGALSLDTEGRDWFRYTEPTTDSLSVGVDRIKRRLTEPIRPAFETVHLWDGGVYDNHGLEGLIDYDRGWKKDIEFLIVSDAAGRSKPEAYQRGSKALMRIITGVMMDQIRSLRARSILERIHNHKDRGAFLQIGNSCAEILSAAGKDDEIAEKCPGCLSPQETIQAAETETDIAKLTAKKFELLFRHGYENADYTLYGFSPDLFNFMGYH
jgi:NTE family protein